MPLARRLMAGGEVLAMHSGERLTFERADLKDWALVDIQVADDIACERSRRNGNKISLPDEIGVVRPPFPMLWMEWGMGELRMAAMIADGDQMENLHPNQMGICLFFADVTHPEIICSDALYVANLRPDGQIDWVYDPPAWRIKGGAWESEKDEESLSQMSIVALFGLTLMNCRNVTTPTAGAMKMRRSGRQKRQGLKPFEVRYNTIKLPGGGSTSAGSGSGTHDRATALHRVRGHTKTFTAEAPLMGKHVGTYWWGWQLRGDPERGIVESDYLLAGGSDE
jgi:hypothetical protein